MLELPFPSISYHLLQHLTQLSARNIRHLSIFRPSGAYQPLSNSHQVHTAELRVFVAQCAHDSHFAPGQVDKSMHFHVALGMTQIDHEYQESTINPNKSTIFPALIHHKSQNNSLQDGAPKIAKLVYKWLNNGLW
jgi:mannose-6-phosphate isomerase-like protein (cupin superfamily)